MGERGICLCLTTPNEQTEIPGYVSTANYEMEFSLPVYELDISAVKGASYHSFPGLPKKEDFPDIFADVSLVVLCLSLASFGGDDFAFKDIIAYCQEKGIPILPCSFASQYTQQRFNEIYPSVHCLFLPRNKDQSVPILKKALNFFYAKMEGSPFHDLKKSFAGRGFLSYRKKDRPLVDKVQALLFKNQRLMGTVLWFDEMLTAGQIYVDEIFQAIDESEAVVFLITPNIFEEGNYVRDVEFPYAKKTKKAMVAVCFEEVDRLRLAKFFPGMPTPIRVDLEEEKAVQALVEAFGHPLPEKGEDAYRIGMAYEHGFLVATHRGWADAFYRYAGGRHSIHALLRHCELVCCDEYQYQNEDEWLKRIGEYRTLVKKMSAEDKERVLSMDDAPWILGVPLTLEDHKDPKQEAFDLIMRGQLGQAEEAIGALHEDQDTLYLRALLTREKGNVEESIPLFVSAAEALKNAPYQIHPAQKAIHYASVCEAVYLLGSRERPKEATDYLDMGLHDFYYRFSHATRPSLMPADDYLRLVCQALRLHASFRYCQILEEYVQVDERMMDQLRYVLDGLSHYGREALLFRVRLLLVFGQTLLCSDRFNDQIESFSQDVAKWNKDLFLAGSLYTAICQRFGIELGRLRDLVLQLKGGNK
ncbi:MAG: toll/interleukin-1 receptor domain-containing protein [Bacilli bacterium]|nr:toll/interleukin-1 receptor domain-containing protein [Bacilli bacterium]